uniref:Uncharacterized protein n=1 Tax=Arundo donax TaxID=35708 RepID=A0A0A8ZVT9_ARUDO
MYLFFSSRYKTGNSLVILFKKRLYIHVVVDGKTKKGTGPKGGSASLTPLPSSCLALVAPLLATTLISIPCPTTARSRQLPHRTTHTPAITAGYLVSPAFL